MMIPGGFDTSVLLFRADGSTPSAKNSLMAAFRLMSGVRDDTEIV